MATSIACCMGHAPSTAGTFREEIPEKFRKDPGNALRAFPGTPLESTAGIPKTLSFKAFEGSRAFPELSPPQYGWGRFFSQKWFPRRPLRAGHGIPSSTGGISACMDVLAKTSDHFSSVLSLDGQIHRSPIAIAFSERGQLSQAIPQFYVERMLNE